MSTLSETVPKYLSISEHLRQQILDGKLPPGSQLTAQAKLARSYGVSLLTARQALGRLEREGFIEQHRGRGTFVARNQAKPSEAASIGLLAVDKGNLTKSSTYFMGLIREMGNVLAARDYDLKVATVDDAAFARRLPHPMLDRRRVRIVVVDGFMSQVHVDIIQGLGLEVLVAGNHPVNEQVPQVCHDVRTAAYLLGKEMMTLAHGPLILFTEPYRYFYTTQLILGYQQAACEAGQPPMIYSSMPDDHQQWDSVLESIVQRHGANFCLMSMVRGTDEALERCKPLKLSMRDIPTCLVGNTAIADPSQESWVIRCEMSAQMLGRTVGERLVDALNEDQPVRGQIFAPVVRQLPPASDRWPLVCEWQAAPTAPSNGAAESEHC